MSQTIKKIIANEIINSRGYPTISARLILSDERQIEVSIPCYEENFPFQNKQLFDEDTRFSGRGVKKVVYYINNLIGPKLINVSPLKQIEIDNWLDRADGTSNKSKLGINTIATISYLIAKAGALILELPLYKYLNKIYNDNYQSKINLQKIPTPIFTLLKGGKHGQVNLDFCQFQIMPSSLLSYPDAYDLGVQFYHLLRHQYKFLFKSNLDVLEAIKNISLKINKRLGQEFFLGIDFCADDFFSNNHYSIKDRSQSLTNSEYNKFIIDKIIKNYSPIVIIDVFSINDIENWKELINLYNKEIYITIDNYFSGKKSQLDLILKQKIANTIIIKPIQIGTLTEIFSLIDFIKKNSFSYIFSSDLEETDEVFIADLSIGLQSDYFSFSQPVHEENVVKYNRVLEISNNFIK